ncbi:hypothetical protein BSKO_00905 [Bryopsis sp. KO-2023]|nr:hypothetical protein BSKO_00905 [Bryopsis sp. KO-2023]
MLALGGNVVRSHCASVNGTQRTSRRQVRVCCDADRDNSTPSRREFTLNSVALAAIFTFGAAPRPTEKLGVRDYGGGVKSLGLCPPTPNCLATSEVANDPYHYAPPLVYNPEDGRGRKNPVTQEQAMEELVSVVKSLKPDKFEPKIIKQEKDYLYVEYESPTFGFIDDVELWFPSDRPGILEYRTASRIGENDGNVNRKRIKAIREALQKKGWVSYGL